MYRPKVYTASKIYHREFWLSLEGSWVQEIEFTARWLRQPPGPDHDTTFWTESQKSLHWIQDIQDVKRSDWLVAYIDEDKDRLSGSLVEIGAALMNLTPIITVGFGNSHSWQSHPLVHKTPSVHEAFRFITGRI